MFVESVRMLGILVRMLVELDLLIESARVSVDPVRKLEDPRMLVDLVRADLKAAV